MTSGFASTSENSRNEILKISNLLMKNKLQFQKWVCGYQKLGLENIKIADVVLMTVHMF